MKILITGSEGSVGKRLMPYLQNKGHCVFGVGETMRAIDNYRVVNINNPIELSEVFYDFRPDVCYHLAARVGRIICEKSPTVAVETNVMGTNSIIHLCRLYQVRLIYFSSCDIYGNVRGSLTEDRELKPNNIYGLSKMMAEQLVNYNLIYGLKAIIVRPFMMYHETEQTGDHHSALICFCDNLIRKQKVTVHIGAERSWIYIDDAIQIYESLLYTEGNYTINIGNPDIYSISELARMICNKLKLSYDDYVEEIPSPQGTSLTKKLDLKKQTELTGFNKFISLSEGLDKVINKMLNKNK